MNKVVLVTGAGGSIGSELSTDRVKTKKLILLELNEFSLYKIYEDHKLIKNKKLYPYLLIHKINLN